MRHSHREINGWTPIALMCWFSFTLSLCLFCATFGASDEVLKVDNTASLRDETSTKVKVRSSSVSSEEQGIKRSADGVFLECPEQQELADCEKDRLGFEAILSLHLMIDDDHNGNVDQSESDEFLRDELQYTDGFERQALFHHNDKYISVDDLWKAWKYSMVYNWTVDDVVAWLGEDVGLPQYVQLFHNNNIDGSYLPRLVNSTGSLLVMLGVRNAVHKQKLSLRAMDTVLFGAPKRVHSYAKDLLLISLLIVAFGGCWFLCLHHRYSQTQVKKMMHDLESLQKAEDALKKLSKELADAERSQRSMTQDQHEELLLMRKNSVRLQVPASSRKSGDRTPSPVSRDGSLVRRQEGERRLQRAEEEMANLREALSEAENRLELQQQLETQWSVPSELQAWMQLTHELEQLSYNAKRQAAERQLMSARDGCDKIKKRNKAFLGSLRMAHSNSLDDIDQSILDARAALEEVKLDLQERLHRWHTMELLCGFPIISNPGLSALKQALGRDTPTSGRVPSSLLGPVSIDEADEDLPPAATFSTEPLQMAGSSKTFLKQQTQILGGSTSSLANTHKRSTGTSPTSTHPYVGKSEVAAPVSFHLGDLNVINKQHERTHSNASTLANGASASMSGRGYPAYSSTLSATPYGNQQSGTNPGSSLQIGTGMNHSQSMPPKSSSSLALALPLVGSSVRLHHSPSGNQLMHGSNGPTQMSPTDSLGRTNGFDHHSPTGAAPSNMEDSDANSVDSFLNNHSAVRGRLERSDEMDDYSFYNESHYVGSTLSTGTPTPENSLKRRKGSGKKKKFLPNFLQKSKHKNKT